MLKYSTYFFALMVLPLAGMGQVDSTATDSVPSPSPPNSLAAPPDTLQGDSTEVITEVIHWDHKAPLGATLTATDSTLRWQLWPSWTYKKNRDPGVISYRLGTIGRSNSQLLNAHEPKYQQLYWEDVRLNDPVSGIVNWNYIPHHQIDALYENDNGVTHRTDFYLKQYYLNEPLTKLNFTEGNFDTRSLQFLVSRNFGQKTNAEISYWDRRDGGEYNNSNVVGRQVYARVSHQLDEQQQLKFHLLNNNYDNDLPFGYVIPNAATFNFDRFVTNATEPRAEATQAGTVIGLNYYRRPADSAQTAANLQAGVFTNFSKREVTYSADSTFYSVQGIGTNIRKWQQLGPLQAEGAASYTYFINKNEDASNLLTGNWGLLKAEGKATFSPFSFLALGGHANFRSRSDGYSDHTIGARTVIDISDRVNFTAGYSSGTRMPTPQQLYWQSNEFSGNENLEEEKIEALKATLNITPFTGSMIGIEAHLKQIENGIIVAQDSIFSNANAYSSLSTSGIFTYNSTHFEFEGSATVHQFGNFLTSRTATLPVDQTERIWFKASAYVKGYLFNRATYVKGGLAGILTPQAYSSAEYFPALDYWQSAGGNFIPSFNGLDVDFSARVRSIIVVLRYENVLDDVVQQGYFETAGYPMGGRRFLFGIRVLFRN